MKELEGRTRLESGSLADNRSCEGLVAADENL